MTYYNFYVYTVSTITRMTWWDNIRAQCPDSTWLCRTRDDKLASPSIGHDSTKRYRNQRRRSEARARTPTPTPHSDGAARDASPSHPPYTTVPEISGNSGRVPTIFPLPPRSPMPMVMKSDGWSPMWTHGKWHMYTIYMYICILFTCSLWPRSSCALLCCPSTFSRFINLPLTNCTPWYSGRFNRHWARIFDRHLHLPLSLLSSCSCRTCRQA